MKCKSCERETRSKSGYCRHCWPKTVEAKQANSQAHKKAYSEGRQPQGCAKKGHDPQGMGSVEWRNQNPEKWKTAIENQRQKVKGVSKKGHPCPQHQKELLSRLMSERLQDPEKRKNYGRGKKSHMEIYFENWLYRNGITGWEYDKHFWNEELKKNYFVDFCFESLKVIVELDGTQHRKTIELDRLRDDYLTRKGYKVIRLPYEEYKKGDWETYLLVKLHAAVVQQV